jgi:renalase
MSLGLSAVSSGGPDQLPVVVVGAGLAGLACARALAAAGLPVVVRDRGRRPGGRLGQRRVADRPVDLGASYFTVRDEDFAEVVADWERRGLARPWTDTFATATPAGLGATKTGPMRWAAPGGLRTLAEDLAAQLPEAARPTPQDEVRAVSPGPTASSGPLVDGSPAPAVVLAMPDPQASRLLDPALAAERAALDAPYEAVIAVAAGWDRRRWPDVAGAFVADSAVLTWFADDGDRRGDAAPVLVAHTTATLAAAHLASPDEVIAPVLGELRAILGIDADPEWTLTQRWTFAKPSATHDEPYLLSPVRIGACGDSWGGHARAEGAFVSGRRLGSALATSLGRDVPA